MELNWIRGVDWYSGEDMVILSPLSHNFLTNIQGFIVALCLFMIILIVARKIKNNPTKSIINKLILIDCLLKLNNIHGFLFGIGLITSKEFCAGRTTFLFFTTISNKMVSLMIAIIRWIYVKRCHIVICRPRRKLCFSRICGSFCVLAFFMTMYLFYKTEIFIDY